MEHKIVPNLTRKEMLTSDIIFSIFVLGITYNLITFAYEPPIFTNTTGLLLIASALLSLIWRPFSFRACGFFIMLASVVAGSALFEDFQMFSLLFALGFLSNGLVVCLNKGMPVQGLVTSKGIHITVDSMTKLPFLGDLSVIGHHSVGDLLIYAGFWTRVVYLA